MVFFLKIFGFLKEHSRVFLKKQYKKLSDSTLLKLEKRRYLSNLSTNFRTIKNIREKQHILYYLVACFYPLHGFQERDFLTFKIYFLEEEIEIIIRYSN